MLSTAKPAGARAANNRQRTLNRAGTVGDAKAMRYFKGS
jgi:hypothetical protein